METGRLDIGYTGEDLVRVRDLGCCQFRLHIRMSNLFHVILDSLLRSMLQIFTLIQSYSPPKEKYDFPIHTGDQWYMPFFFFDDCER